MRVLIATLGSHGDILPFIALGRELQARGHDVRFYTSEYFGDLVRAAGLQMQSVMAAEFVEFALNEPDLTHPIRGIGMIAEGFVGGLPEQYEIMKRDVEPGNTITLASSFAFAPRLLKEKYGIPTATIHLAPSLFRSNHWMPRMMARRPHQGAPQFLKRLVWASVDSLFLDRIFGVPLNQYRAELGLAPVKRVLHQWIHEGDVTVGMFPEWFGQAQPDWPANVQLTDFPLYDHGEHQPLSDEVRRFLDAGEPPIAFTAGTGTATVPEFFAASAQACRRMGKRGILLTRHAGQVPQDLPPDVVRLSYVPFGALLPRLAAFVHHGGIGTTSQALRAGVPQLVRPMGYDQFDNADRVIRLGVGDELLPRNYRPQALEKSLARLMNDPALRTRCAAVARRLRDSDGIAQTCDAILARAVPRSAGETVPPGNGVLDGASLSDRR